MMRCIAESGMLYTVTALVVLVCQLSNNYLALRVASAVVRSLVAMFLCPLLT